MTFYRPVSFFLVLIPLLSLSVFYFLEDEDTIAKHLVFFTLFAFVLVFLVLKSLYYLRHGATFNELFFVVGLPLLPPFFAALGQFTEINDLYFSDLISASFTMSGEVTEFSLSFASILSLPFLFFSVYLLLRTFIRYEFIRWQAHSTGGPPGTLVGLILAIGIGALYLIVSIILADLLLAFFGFIYALNGILGFLA